MNKEKVVKIVKIAISALWWIVLFAVAALTVSIFAAKIRGEVPSVFGYSVMHIVSGSMEPEIPAHSYILVKSEAPENIKRGQIITFYSEEPEIYGAPNTHRVVEDPIVGENGIEFVTAGDAVGKIDAVTAKGDSVIGVYVRELSLLTAFAGAIGGNTMYFIIMALMLGLVIMTVWGLFTGSDKEKPSAKTEEEIAQEAIKEYIAKEAVREYIEKQKASDAAAAENGESAPHSKDGESAPDSKDGE